MQSFYLHDLNPYAWKFPEFIQRAIETFSGPLAEPAGIRWYGLAYLTGTVVGYLLVSRLVKLGRVELNSEQLLDFATYVVFGTLIGGRVGYALFYSPDLLLEFGGGFPYWGVLKVHQGGMASHGGIAGIIVATWLYAYRNKKSFLHLLDLTTFGGAIGIFFGRIANFVNGELYGRVTESFVKWAVQFPQEMHLWTRSQVSQLVDLAPAVQALGPVSMHPGEMPAVIQPEMWKGWVMNFNTDSGARRAVEQGIESLIHATQNHNEAVKQALSVVLAPRHPSQIYQALLEGLLVFFVLAWMWRKPRKPGVIAGVFGITYAIARIVGEEFRLPDAHLGFQALGLTRGQWLSIGFLVFAIGFLIYARRRKTSPIGGWS